MAGLLVLALVIPVQVMAMPTLPDEWADEWTRMMDMIDDLRRQNENLTRQLNEVQSTPTPPQNPLVHLINPTSIDIMPGEVLSVDITVRNIGTGTAHSLLTQAVTTGPFVVEFLNNTNIVNSLSQNSQRQMTMRISVNANATPGTHTIDLTHLFRNNAGTNTSTTNTIVVRIGGETVEPGTPLVRLTNIQSSVYIASPGQNFVVTADVQNIGTVPAYNVQVAVGNLGGATIFSTGTGQAFLPTLEPGQTRQVSFNLQASQDMPSSVHRLDFLISGEDISERTTPFFVAVLAEHVPTESANIEMRGLTAPTGRLNVGQTGQISFELVNTGNGVAQDVVVTATDPQGHLVPMVAHVQNVRTLAIGEAQAFNFSFMPTSSAQTQAYAIRLNVEYTIAGAEGRQGFMLHAGLNVYNPEREEATPTPGPTGVQIPRIIVDEYSVDPQIPRAGQTFEMEIYFLNTSPTRSVNNIRVTLNSAVGEQGAVFTPVGGSNTLFIPYMGPGEYVTKTVTMFTIPDAPPRVYTLDVVFDFQDDDYDTHQMTERLSIPVAQQAELMMYPLPFVPPMMDMWGFFEFEFQVINTGRVNLRNTWVTVEGPFDTSEATMFLSTIASGRTITYRGLVRPEPGTSGQLEGAIVVRGVDDAGDYTEARHPFSIYVMGGGFGDDFDGGFGDGFDRFPEDDGWLDGGGFGRPDFGEPDWNGGGDDDGGILELIRRPIFFGPALGVLGVAVIAVAVIIRRKKSKLSFDDNFN